MDDEGQRPPGTIGTLWAAPEKKLGAEPKQLDLWPAAQSATNAAVGSEDQHAASVDAGAPARACDQRAKFLPMIVPPAASSCDHEIRAPRRDAFEMSAAFAGAPWHPALVTGALAVAFGVGWIAGAGSSRFFAPVPATTPVQQASAPSCAREAGQEIACAAKTDRQAMAGAAAKAAAPGASDVNRWHERSRNPRLASAAANKDPSTTNSIASAGTATQERTKVFSRPAAVPETRPTTVEGWTIREVAGGTVVLDGPSGAWRAAQGDTVPGVGRIDSIVRWGSRWIVATTKGLISTQD